jgi:hypothetical protein
MTKLPDGHANHRLDQIVSPLAALAGFVWSAVRYAASMAAIGHNQSRGIPKLLVRNESSRCRSCELASAKWVPE